MPTGKPTNVVRFRPYRSEDRLWVEETNLRFYRTEHNFDATFGDALVEALNLIERQRSEVGSHYLIAEHDKGLAGCIFLCADVPAVGRVRLFYLDEEYRGRGIGMRLLSAVVSAARGSNMGKVHVSTFDRHPEACRLYETFGFKLIRTASVKAFGHDMMQMDYELQLGR